jgi:hypothetical protein
LSLDDLFALLDAPLAALLEEVAPGVLPVTTGGEPELLSAGVLLFPHADAISRYVRLSTYAQGRVEGASDQYAVDWYPSSLAEIATPEARTAAIRERIEGLFIDGGYRGFEHALAQSVHRGVVDDGERRGTPARSESRARNVSAGQRRRSSSSRRKTRCRGRSRRTATS